MEVEWVVDDINSHCSGREAAVAWWVTFGEGDVNKAGAMCSVNVRPGN